MTRRAISAGLLSVLVVASCQGARESRHDELSGVERLADSLLLVSDDAPGTYYVVGFGNPAAGHAPVALDGARAVVLPGGSEYADPEDIAILPDRRVAILSEARCAILLSDGLSITYPHDVDEFAGRGLEGLDVTTIDGHTMIAVAWEGGYPDRRKLSSGPAPSMTWMAPRLLIHEMPSTSVRLTMDDVDEVVLQVPMPPGDEPGAQRFRVPAILWHEWRDGTEPRRGFILLMNSENATTSPVYAHVWLQRVTRDGRSIGEPVDVNRSAPPSLVGANWEGMCWWESGQSLLLVHDQSSNLESGGNEALVIELPDDWR